LHVAAKSHKVGRILNRNCHDFTIPLVYSASSRREKLESAVIGLFFFWATLGIQPQNAQ
jgi:hypothetical protein